MSSFYNYISHHPPGQSCWNSCGRLEQRRRNWGRPSGSLRKIFISIMDGRWDTPTSSTFSDGSHQQQPETPTPLFLFFVSTPVWPSSFSSSAGTSRRRTGCPCWRSTGSTRESKPSSASWKSSSANRILPNPSDPSSENRSHRTF